MHFDKGAHAAPEIVPPVVLWPATPEVWPKGLIFRDQVVESHRLVRGGHDCSDRSRILGAEPVDEHILKVAERDAAIDRPARSEGHDQRVGTSCAPFRTLGRA